MHSPAGRGRVEALWTVDPKATAPPAGAERGAPRRYSSVALVLNAISLAASKYATAPLDPGSYVMTDWP